MVNCKKSRILLNLGLSNTKACCPLAVNWSQMRSPDIPPPQRETVTTTAEFEFLLSATKWDIWWKLVSFTLRHNAGTQKKKPKDWIKFTELLTRGAGIHKRARLAMTFLNPWFFHNFWTCEEHILYFTNTECLNNARDFLRNGNRVFKETN